MYALHCSSCFLNFGCTPLKARVSSSCNCWKVHIRMYIMTIHICSVMLETHLQPMSQPVPSLICSAGLPYLCIWLSFWFKLHCYTLVDSTTYSVQYSARWGASKTHTKILFSLRLYLYFVACLCGLECIRMYVHRYSIIPMICTVSIYNAICISIVFPYIMILAY